MNQNSQNPTIISQSKEIEVDQSFYKIVILGVFAAGLNVAGVYFFNQFLITAESGNLILSLIAGILFLALIILQVFLIKSRFRLGLLMFVEAFAPVVLFYSRFTVFNEIPFPLVIGAVIFFVFLCVASMRGHRTLANSLKIKFWVVAKSVTPKATSGLLLFFAVLIYLNYFKWGNFNETLGQRFVSESIRSSEAAIRIWIPNFSSNKPIGDTINDFIESQLKNMKADKSGDLKVNFDQLPEAAQKIMIEEAAKGIKGYLGKTLSSFNVKDSLSDVVYRFLKNYAERLSATSKSMVGIVISLLIFFALKGIAALFYWFIELIGYLIFKFVLVTNFAHINLETRSREFVILS
ncbi:MAG: hypothetical protein QMD50_01440 [Patescibacteria group bacterium]|nr:hypothetical protein [Patescibacteria group bacterium]